MTGIKSPSIGVLAVGALALIALKWSTTDAQPVVHPRRVNNLREDVRLLARMDLMDRRLKRLSQLSAGAPAEQPPGQNLDLASAQDSRATAGHPPTDSGDTGDTSMPAAQGSTAALPHHVSTREAARAATGRASPAGSGRH